MKYLNDSIVYDSTLSIGNFIRQGFAGWLSGVACGYVTMVVVPSHHKIAAVIFIIILLLLNLPGYPRMISEKDWLYLTFNIMQNIGIIVASFKMAWGDWGYDW